MHRRRPWLPLIVVSVLLPAALPGAAPAAISAPAAGPAELAYRVPFRLTNASHLLVRARVNGRGPLNLLVDTGAPALFLSPAAAKRTGLTAGSDGWAPVARFEIEGGAVLPNVRARVEEPPQIAGMNAMGLGGVRLDGVMGYQILAHFRIQIDLTRSTMVWTDTHSEPQPLPGSEELAGLDPGASAKAQGTLDSLARMATTLLARGSAPEPAPHGFLGVELESRSGVRIRSVLRGAPAAAGGLAAGDRILAVARGTGSSQPVKSAADLRRLTADLAAGERFRFSIRRGDRTLERTVRAGSGGF